MSLPFLRTRSERLALTLLEMLVATVMAALLFAVLTSVLRSFADQQRAIDRLAARQPPTQLLAELLRYDLINAQYVQHGLSGLKLRGTTARDWTTRLPTGRLAEVTYRVAKIGDEPWLLRQEVHLDETRTQRTRVEPVWQGVASIDLMIDHLPIDEEASDSANPIAAGMLAAPSQMIVIVRHRDGGQLLNMKIRHHWEDL